MSSLLWIDVESTAFGDKAATIEIALYPVINGEEKEPFHSYIRPHEGATISPEALTVNKIDPKLFPTFPTVNEVVENIIKYVDQFETVFSLAGHKVSFDKGHLFRMFTRTAHYSDYVVRFDSKEVCTLKMAEVIFKGKVTKKPKSNKLGDLCEYFGIDLKNAHTADADIKATMQLYNHLEGLMPKLIKPVNNMTYHQKRSRYMAADYLTINPEGDVYINNKCTQDQDAMIFALNELWRIYVK